MKNNPVIYIPVRRSGLGLQHRRRFSVSRHGQLQPQILALHYAAATIDGTDSSDNSYPESDNGGDSEVSPEAAASRDIFD